MYTVLSPLKFPGLNVQFQVLVNIYSMQSTWESHNGQMGMFSSYDSVDHGSNLSDFTRLVWIFKIPSGIASGLFASSEGYVCDCHWPAKSPMSAFLSLLRLRLFSNILTSSCHLVICGCRLSLGGLDGLPCIMNCPIHNEILSITLHECSLFTIYHTVFIILHPSRDLRLPSASRLNSSIDCLE